MTEFKIRLYQPDDRDAVHRIAADTAFFGEPVEVFLDDRRVFCDAFYRYYTDLEPEHGWVACAEDQVVGFLVGCVDSRSQQQKVPRRLLLPALGRLLRGRYRFGRRTWRYVTALAGAQLRGEFPQADLDLYPAHLHINLAARWRGRGLGRRLIQAYLGQLRQLSVPGVHLHTTSRNTAACRLYESSGFRLLDARPTRLWQAFLDQPVENRCYGLRMI